MYRKLDQRKKDELQDSTGAEGGAVEANGRVRRHCVRSNATKRCVLGGSWGTSVLVQVAKTYQGACLW